jgi:hypothetical protein
VDCALSNGVPPSVVDDMRTSLRAEEIEAQLELCPRAALPKLSTPVEGR